MKTSQQIADIEDAARTAPAKHQWRDLSLPPAARPIITAMLNELVRTPAPTEQTLRELQRRFHHAIKPTHFMQTYLEETAAGRMPNNAAAEALLTSSRCRAVSGVSVVTVFLSPYPDGQRFSCKWNCSYCPNEPGQPRSYVFKEPGVLRANQCGFDAAEQMWARIAAYRVNGHPTDKFEVLILGGTIASYPKRYLEEFMRDVFYAANTCGDHGPKRGRQSLEFEKRLNSQMSGHRIIGVTVETRPDCITPAELRDFRRWGVTRVQLGVQHTDDAILRRANRGHGLSATIAAMKLLRESCFKVDIHLMPNLPGATPAADKAMFDYVLAHLHPDQVKVYPCTTMPFTRILEEYKAGTYQPYGNDALTDVILYWKDRVHPWIRNNRIVRDIPDSYIVDGVKTSNQRMEFQAIHTIRGGRCRCIRCREAGRHPTADADAGHLVRRDFVAQDGLEVFLSWESDDEAVLFGFLRLRLARNLQHPAVFPELTNKALVRELHVYGRTVAVGAAASRVGDTQHKGIGRRLLAEAERIAWITGHDGVAVISGVGVQRYYAGHGYVLDPGAGEFMMKRFRIQLFLAAAILVGVTAILLAVIRWAGSRGRNCASG